MTISNSDGTIDELVTISIEPTEIVSAGYGLNEFKTDVEEKSQAQAQLMADKLNQKINNDLFKVLDKESREILNSYFNGIEVVKSDWNNNTYAIGIRFKNIDIYKYYYNVTENTQVEMQTKKHFFYNKMYYYSSTMFVKHNELFNNVNAYYSTQYPGLIESDTAELLYTYKTDLRRQHSDADYITKQNGEYYHTWVVDKDNVEEPIMLYYNVANPESFIIVALEITAGVTIILLLIGFVINKHKQNKQEEIQPIETN